LLAAANAAVVAVKKATQLYKDVKNAAGDVREVLDDLKAQFHKVVDPTPAQKMQYNAEVQRVQEIAKADPNDVFTEIGNQLGVLMDAYDALSKALLQEELSGRKVYKGEESIGRRALRRIIITSRLDAMLVEIRETMIYRAPPELGSLWGKFETMWKRIVAEQEAAHVEELKQDQIAKWRRANIKRKLKEQLTSIIAVLFIMLWFVWVMILIRTSQTYRGHYSSPWWSCVLC
jgi:uncharacterized coiled-coil DUF342 family protein